MMFRDARQAAVTLNVCQGLSCSTAGVDMDKCTLIKVQGDGVVK